MKITNFISQVEKNKDNLNINDTIIYMDSCNYQEWKITDLFEGGFECIDKDGYEDFFFFEELQLGWEISEKTKENMMLNNKVFIE